MAGMCVYRRSIPLPLIVLMFPRAEHPGVFPSEDLCKGKGLGFTSVQSDIISVR